MAPLDMLMSVTAPIIEMQEIPEEVIVEQQNFKNALRHILGALESEKEYKAGGTDAFRPHIENSIPAPFGYGHSGLVYSGDINEGFDGDFIWNNQKKGAYSMSQNGSALQIALEKSASDNLNCLEGETGVVFTTTMHGMNLSDKARVENFFEIRVDQATCLQANTRESRNLWSKEEWTYVREGKVTKSINKKEKENENPLIITVSDVDELFMFTEKRPYRGTTKEIKQHQSNWVKENMEDISKFIFTRDQEKESVRQ